MAEINWLHLSDIHFNSKETFDQEVIHEAFINDLINQLESRKIQLDYIFFTGDVAYSASKDDYECALEFFGKLCDVIRFDKKNLFIIPGNHDVNRYKVSKFLDDERNKLETREEIRGICNNIELMNRYLERFDNYSNFISKLYGKDFVMDSTNYYFADNKIANNKMNVGIIGLNSAWTSYGGRNDCNNIYVSEVQLKQAINKVAGASLKMVLMHHPPTWLYEEDRTDVESLLYQNCHVLLHGHLHSPDFQISSLKKGQIIIIPAGAIYTDRRVSNSYNIA